MLRGQKFAFVSYRVCTLRLFSDSILYPETETLTSKSSQPRAGNVLADTGYYRDIQFIGQRAATTCANTMFNPRRVVEGGYIEVGKLVASNPIALTMLSLS